MKFASINERKGGAAKNTVIANQSEDWCGNPIKR